VRPISSANFAGGLFSSVNPQTKIPEGTMKVAYQKYLEAPRLPPTAPPSPPPWFNIFAARSFRAARSAIRSMAVTGCCGLTRLVASEKRREKLAFILVVFLWA
jgi:hypothetical protein